MEEIRNEQTELAAQPAEAEKEKGEEKSEVSLGKFKDARALLDAYNSLQSEFTKRCQKIKELESLRLAVDKVSAPTQSFENERDNGTIGEEKEKILKEYLKEIIGKKPKAIVMDGGGERLKTPLSRPKTIEEAGSIAKKILNK